MAHVTLISVHALCCGMPILAMLAAALSGATSSIALLSDFVAPFHDLLHQHEIWILIVSAGLVSIGGGLELWARRPGQAPASFPWLFAVSTLCFLANVAIILAHRS